MLASVGRRVHGVVTTPGIIATMMPVMHPSPVVGVRLADADDAPAT
jgi:hypothetical protein